MISPGEHLLDAPGADWQGGGPADRRSRLKHVKAISPIHIILTDLTDLFTNSSYVDAQIGFIWYLYVLVLCRIVVFCRLHVSDLVSGEGSGTSGSQSVAASPTPKP